MAENARPAETRPQVSTDPGFDLEAAIDAALKNGFPWMRFEPPLERYMEERTGRARGRHFVRTTLVAWIVYMCFLVSDYMFTPDTFHRALVVRVGIVTTAAAIVLPLLWRGLPPFPRETLETGLLLLTGLSVIYLYGLGEDPGAFQYDSGLILVIAFMAVVARVRFWYTLATVATLMVTYVYATGMRFSHAPEVVQHNAMVLAAGALFLIAANYALEREQRRAFLYRTQNRIHVDALSDSNHKLDELSHLDPLTGVANRRELDDLLARLCPRAADEPFGIIMVDIDYFKNYNDHYGHAAGDDCIRRVAAIMQATMRLSGDRVVRYGGEEFMALLPRTSARDCLDVAERLRQAVSDLAIPHERSLIATVVTISAGAHWVSIVQTPKAVLAEVDHALYRAKGEGRNRVCASEAAEGRGEQ